MVVETTRSIEISWDELRKEFDWTTYYWGEWHILSYLLRHPEKVQQELGAGLELIAVEAGVRNGREVDKSGNPKMKFIDLLYRQENSYFVVETERNSIDARKGKKEAKERAVLLEGELKQRVPRPIVVPVFIGVKFPPPGEPLVGELLSSPARFRKRSTQASSPTL